MKKLAVLLVSLSLIFAAGCSSSDSTIRFGTAGVGGMYSAFANAYTQLAADENDDLQFQVRSTAGSAANLRLLSENYIQLGIAQADVTDEAYHGTGDFEGSKTRGYSAVAALYTEACQIVVRADSDIETPDDLIGRTVSIGEEESGTERNAKQILQIYGLSDDLITCKNYDYTEAAEALTSGEIDAMFCTAGVQTTVIEELTRDCDIRLLSIDETHAQKLIRAYPSYVDYVIPADTYTGQTQEIPTIGVQSLLLVSDELSEDTVEKLTEALFTHSQEIQYALSMDLKMDAATATQDVSIPFHPGAAAYYEAQGISVSTDE